MYSLFTSFLGAFLVASRAVFACQEDMHSTYDILGSSDVSIAIAIISDIRIEAAKPSCWVVDYEQAEYLSGSGKSHFSVTNCTDEFYDADEVSEMLADSYETYGFKRNTEVVMGIVRPTNNTDELRYAIPNCWGYLHYNLEDLSKEERAGLLRSIRNQVESTE